MNKSETKKSCGNGLFAKLLYLTIVTCNNVTVAKEYFISERTSHIVLKKYKYSLYLLNENRSVLKIYLRKQTL